MSRTGSQLSRRALMAACGLLGVAWAPSVSAQATPGVTKDEIVLGGVFALTGPVRLITEPYEQGIRAYFSRVNKEGGINGRKIKWLVEDDAYTPAKALAAAKKLVDRDGVAFLFGQLGTQTTAAISTFTEQAKIPFFSASPAAATTHTHTYTLMASYGDEMELLTEFLVQKKGTKHIAYLYQNDDQGEAGRVGLDRALKHLTSELVASVGFERGTSDFGTQLLKLKESGADAVLVNSTAPAVAAAIKQGRAIGYSPIWATYGIGGSNILMDLLGNSIDGLVFATELDQFSDDQAGRELAADLKAVYPNAKADYATYLGCAHARLIVGLLRAVGPDVTRDRIMQVAKSDLSFPTGVMAPVHYGETNRSGATALRIFEWQAGKPVPQTEWTKIAK